MARKSVVVVLVCAAALVSGCTGGGEERVPSVPSSASPSPAEEPEPSPSAEPPGVVEIDVTSPSVPDAIEAGVVEVLGEDVPWGWLQPDGGYLVSQDAEGGDRFGALDPATGEVRWLTEALASSEDSWWHPVGLHGDWIVLERAWGEKAAQDLEQGILLAIDSASGTTVDLTQADPGSSDREFVMAEVVGDHVYWVEGSGLAFQRELARDAETSVLTKDAWIEVDQCVATSAGHNQVYVSRGAEVVRLGPDGELRPLGPQDVEPDLHFAGQSGLECAGWLVEQLAVDPHDESSGWHLALTDGSAVTSFVAPDWAAFTVDALSESWLLFRIDSGQEESNGLQLVYDRKGQQLYRLGAAPFAGAMELALDGEVFAFTAQDGPDGEQRRVIGSLSSPAR